MGRAASVVALALVTVVCSLASSGRALCQPARDEVAPGPVGCPPEVLAGATCSSLGLGSGALVADASCQGLDVGRCLACTPGRDVLCTQAGLGGAHVPTRGFRIAEGRERAAIAWVSGHGGLVFFATIDPPLELRFASRSPSLAVAGDYALSASRTGWLFAFVSARGLEVAALDHDGAVVGAPVLLGAVAADAELDLFDLGSSAILVAHAAGRGTQMHRVAADGAASSPADLEARLLPRHGRSASGGRVLVAPYRADGQPPRQGDVVVAWAGRDAVAYGQWQADATTGGIGTLEATSELDVALPTSAQPNLTIRMRATPTGTLDELIPAVGRARSYPTRAPVGHGLYTPTRPDQPRIVGVTHVELRSLRGVLSVGMVPAFVPRGEAAVDAFDRGAQLPLALFGPRRGVTGLRERIRAGRARGP